MGLWAVRRRRMGRQTWSWYHVMWVRESRGWPCEPGRLFLVNEKAGRSHQISRRGLLLATWPVVVPRRVAVLSQKWGGDVLWLVAVVIEMVPQFPQEARSARTTNWDRLACPLACLDGRVKSQKTGPARSRPPLMSSASSGEWVLGC